MTQPTNAVLRVRLKNGLVMFHSRRGLTVETNKATIFKTLKYAVRVARKKYSPDRDVVEWNASTLGESVVFLPKAGRAELSLS